jgi:hypothetical protein
MRVDMHDLIPASTRCDFDDDGRAAGRQREMRVWRVSTTSSIQTEAADHETDCFNSRPGPVDHGLVSG